MSNKTFDKIFPPTDEVRHFTHAGIKCMVRMGSWTINGYIELPEGHPWIGIGTWDHPADVHGGVTLSEGRVQGFDTSHSCDRPHPESPYAKKEFPLPRYLRGGRLWQWDDVIAETKRFAEQAAQAATHAEEQQ